MAFFKLTSSAAPAGLRNAIKATAMMLGGILAAVGSAAAAGVADEPVKPALISGVLNLRTGKFMARPANVAGSQVAVVVNPTTGTLAFTINITLKTTFVDTTYFRCQVDASTHDETFSEESMFFDSKSVVATRVGDAATCKVFLAYSWLLSNPAATVLSMDYSVYAVPGEKSIQRNHTGHVPSITVPVSGSTTNRTVNVTL
jgi:hypothetical protein